MDNGSGDGTGGVRARRLDGFVVKSQTVRDGELWLLVETAAGRPGARAAGCGPPPDGRRRVTVRDLSIAGTPTVTVWAKRTWSCRDMR